MKTATPAKRKRESYGPDADVYTYFGEKPKRGRYILADDGEILEVVDDEWSTDELVEDRIDRAWDAN